MRSPAKLTLDETTLTDALANSRLDVKAFLTDATDGISKRLTAQMDVRLKAKTTRLKSQFAAMDGDVLAGASRRAPG